MVVPETIPPGEYSRCSRRWLGQLAAAASGFSQPLKLFLLFMPEILLLVTLSFAVLRGVVFGAPLGLIVATTALPAFPLLLPPLRTTLLHLGQSRMKFPYALHW